MGATVLPHTDCRMRWSCHASTWHQVGAWKEPNVDGPHLGQILVSRNGKL